MVVSDAATPGATKPKAPDALVFAVGSIMEQERNRHLSILRIVKWR